MLQLRADDYLLRPFTSTDAPAFAAAVRESMASLAPWMLWGHDGYTEQEALDWFAMCDAARAANTAHEFGIFSADGARFIGGAGLNQLNSSCGLCNLGYWVRESAQRQGAAGSAAAALARYAFGPLGLTRVEIVVAEGNEASLAVARKSGAQYECLARNRLRLRSGPVAAHVYSLVP
jgi:RimJ/RimL family protein N-acetyltransferase